MRREILRMTNLYTINSNHERLEGINEIIRKGDSCLIWGRDHTGHTFIDLFCKDTQILLGTLHLNGVEMMECNEEAFKACKVYYLDSQVDFVQTLDLAENMFVLKQNHLSKIFLNQKAMHLRAKEILERYNLNLDTRGNASSLSAVDKLFLQIIMFVDQGAEMLVLNNVSSICGTNDMIMLKELLLKLRKEKITLLIYDSSLENFSELVEKVYIVNACRIEKKITDMSELKRYTELISTKLTHTVVKTQVKRQERLADQNRFSISGKLAKTKFKVSVGEGEILYLASAYGHEQEMLWKILRGEGDGKLVVEKGNLSKIYGTKSALLRDKIGFWGEEDLDNELFGNLTIRDNILMPTVKKISKWGFYKTGAQFIFQDKEFFEEFNLEDDKRIYNDKYIMQTIFYRWKLFHPHLLVINNVISRADVEMKEWLLERLLELAERKTSIILLESTSEEALRIADRVIVVKEGNAKE